MLMAKEEERREKEMDSEDEEIVFVGRDGKMQDVPPSPASLSASMMSETEVDKEREGDVRRGKLGDEALIFESREGEHGAAFGRWLVHSIGAYYCLKTWSVTVGEPARREAYVGIKDGNAKFDKIGEKVVLPRPLWGLV